MKISFQKKITCLITAALFSIAPASISGQEATKNNSQANPSSSDTSNLFSESESNTESITDESAVSSGTGSNADTEKSDSFTFSADSMTATKSGKSNSSNKSNSNTNSAGSEVLLSGNASVQTNSISITADTIQIIGENYNTIIAKGNVKGSNSESQFDFSCQTMVYNTDTKKVLLTDSVHLIDVANNVSADAEKIEYDQSTQTAIMQINVTIKQENNVCTAAYAIYHKEEQLLDLSGNPNVKQGNDSFRAQQITLNLQTQQITLDGRVRGSVTSSSSGEKK